LLNYFFKSKAVLLIVLVVLIGLKIKAKQYPRVPTVAIDTPEIDLIFPINDPLDPTNFSLGLIDFQLPLNIQNNVQYNPLTGQYIFNSFLGDSLNFRPSSEVSLNDYLMMQHEKSMTGYKIVDTLGKGGMGEVYLAIKERIDSILFRCISNVPPFGI
jgi:hypothetical protein